MFTPKKYNGKLIYKTKDQEGTIHVIDDGIHRSLYFDSKSKQSALLLNDSHVVALAYARCMLASLLFKFPPKKVLFLGLGGGSIPRFIFERFPNCKIDIVEFREKIYDVAKEYFYFPEDPRIQVTIGDAGDFVLNRNIPDYDIIFSDAYHSEGISESIENTEFFYACKRNLTSDGVFSANFWASNPNFLRHSFPEIRDCYDGNVLRLPVMSRDNQILIGLKIPVSQLNSKILRVKALKLGQVLGIEYSKFLRDLYRYNPNLN
jgi:spermidine synthase